MRQLHKLLPIAREYLMLVGGKSGRVETYACFAAASAAEVGRISTDECRALQRAIGAELKFQSPSDEPAHCTLKGLLTALGYDFLSRYSDDYMVARDKWLDEFQAKLVREDR